MMGKPSAQKQHYTGGTGLSQGLVFNYQLPLKRLTPIQAGNYGLSAAVLAFALFNHWRGDSMNSKIVSAAAVSLIALVMAGCSATPTKSAEAPKAAAAAAPLISEEAQKALAQADADVKAAKAKFALWTTAETAFKAAQEAAKAGDSAGVISQSKFVSGQVKQGMAQLNYPTTEQK
jgi:murein lipoprotein